MPFYFILFSVSICDQFPTRRLWPCDLTGLWYSAVRGSLSGVRPLQVYWLSGSMNGWNPTQTRFQHTMNTRLSMRPRPTVEATGVWPKTRRTWISNRVERCRYINSFWWERLSFEKLANVSFNLCSYALITHRIQQKVTRDALIQKLNILPIFVLLLRSAYWRVRWRSPMFICYSHLGGNNCCSESKPNYPGYERSGIKVLPIHDQSWVSLSCQSWCFTLFL